MKIRTALAGVGGSSLLAAAATAALAIPAQAMPAPLPNPDVPAPVATQGTPAPGTSTDSGATDWSDVGIGVAGGVLFGGGALGAALALRRNRRPRMA